MKRVFVFLVVLALCTFVFAEEEAVNDTDISVVDDTGDVSLSETSEEEYDEFDELFADAQDLEEAVVVEEKKTVTQTVVQSISNTINLTGHLTADLGLAGVITENDFDPSGYLNMENYFYIDVRPNNVFQFHTSIYSNIKSLSTPLTFETFYFDYLFLKSIFISAGKKGISWGNTRLFNDDDYYTQGSYHNTNIMSDSGAFVVCQIRYPWSTGTLSFIPMCPLYVISSGAIGYRSFQYAISYETVLFHSNVNFFGRLYDGHKYYADPLLGLEIKRTLFGFDCYGQGIVRMNDVTQCTNTSGYNYVMGTVGIYRLWDGFDPNFGFNVEYQITRQHASDNTPPWVHLIAFEGGIKRLGKSKNHKIGVTWHHNILDVAGQVELAYIISGIFPYANWTNGVKYFYEKADPLKQIQIATTISLDLGY